MNVYYGNFGLKNWAWKQCHEENFIAVMDDVRVHPFWKQGDRAGYIDEAVRVLKGRNGKSATAGAASRWFNANTILMETSGDIWIHRDNGFLWWTISTDEKPEHKIMVPPIASNPLQKEYVYFKPCKPWSNRDRKGVPLLWGQIDPRARNFLSSVGTFKLIKGSSSEFVRALIEGEEVAGWFDRRDLRSENARPSKGAGKHLTAEKRAAANAEERMRQTAARMVKTALQTAVQSGQEIIATAKDKHFLFANDIEALEYALELMRKQEGRCALTGLKLLLDGDSGDDQLRYSLDRIDSSGHYERGNLQVVCKFINKWKGAMANEEFKRLLALLRS